MDESSFDRAAEALLEALLEAIEACGADVEADLEGGVLTIELADGRQLLVNKHAASREIWVSSPASGAHHFALDEAAGAWRDRRGGRDLRETLAEDVAALTGASLRLS